MNRTLPLLLALALVRTAALAANPLAKPASVSVQAQGPRFSWPAVVGAQLYRVAVFDAPDAEGKRLLLAAVWVATDHWAYGVGAVVPRAAKLISTKPLPLPLGHRLRVMVAAAGVDGADKSEWTGADFQALAPVAAVLPPVATPTPTVSPSPTAIAPIGGGSTPLSASADATLDIEGGDEFKTSPDPAVIDLQDSTKTALAPATAALPIATLPAAQALLKAGKDDDAEAAFRALLAQDPRSAPAWEGLGDSYADRSMKVEAADAYEKALQINGGNQRLKDWVEKNVRY